MRGATVQAGSRLMPGPAEKNINTNVGIHNKNGIIPLWAVMYPEATVVGGTYSECGENRKRKPKRAVCESRMERLQIVAPSDKSWLTMDKYVTFLKSHGMKVTPQRLEIMRYLDRHRTHPTADEIFRALRKDNPSLSKTTIYNTLETLRERGLIQAVGISETEMRYDFRREMHHHFLCTSCGSIFDIDVKCQFLEKTLEGEHRVDEVHGYFKGVCKSCLDRQRKDAGAS